MSADVAARLAAYPAFGWREHVPPFDATRPLVIFDGVCVLCSRSMRLIARNDRTGRVQFTAAQSPLGQALFRYYGLDSETFETVLLIEHGRAYTKRDAVAGIARHLRFPWSAATVYGWLPRRLADGLYDALARRRYRLFGRSDACLRPDPSWIGRVIE